MPKIRIQHVEEKFRTRVAGVSCRQKAVSRCYEGQSGSLVRAPENEHDSNVVEIHADEMIGYIPAEDSEVVERHLDSSTTPTEFRTERKCS
ncbi:MAG: HIRAN domain-containing protein [Rhodospirillaceae bacterium]|nr:HIRAN domain-containing protein [Rhodospirillaceae bacterium]